MSRSPYCPAQRKEYEDFSTDLSGRGDKDAKNASQRSARTAPKVHPGFQTAEAIKNGELTASASRARLASYKVLVAPRRPLRLPTIIKGNNAVNSGPSRR
ncbi:hypothetical protein NYO67_8070 [Aspergillus flavus]|nr:hypothetical protein NYO67_8070 [Aspergillus flavus]